MVISFSSDPAFLHLEEHGYVATFRKSRRENPNCETWCNRGRGETKEFDVRITEVGEVAPIAEELAPFALMSGFGEVRPWQQEIHELNGTLPDSGWLYFVTKI